MKKFAIAAVAALVAASAFAAAGWVGAGVINVGGVWYYADQHESTTWASGPYANADLGTYNTAFDLGGQLQMWDEGSADWGQGTSAFMYYKIDDAADFTKTTLEYYKFQDNNNFFQTGGEPMVALSIDISGLDEGAHTLSIKFEDYDGKKPTDVYTANFTRAVPEPATMSLLGLGALAMVIRRKLSK